MIASVAVLVQVSFNIQQCRVLVAVVTTMNKHTADEGSDSEDDYNKPLSKSYTTARTLRIDRVVDMSNEFTAAQLHGLDDNTLDQLVYIWCNVQPSIRLADLRCMRGTGRADLRLATMMRKVANEDKEKTKVMRMMRKVTLPCPAFTLPPLPLSPVLPFDVMYAVMVFLHGDPKDSMGTNFDPNDRHSRNDLETWLFEQAFCSWHIM